MKVGSLFSGIGGLDLGLELAGMETAWQTEIDPYCMAELQKEWPDIENLGDVRSIDWQTMKAVDLLCTGFPCQPASVAGKRKGTEDDRWLWPEVTRALRILRPEYAILENVPGLLTVNGGAAFNEVISDLAEIGYGCRWTCLQAAWFGAPHRRERLFILAYAQSIRRPEDIFKSINIKSDSGPWSFSSERLIDSDGYTCPLPPTDLLMGDGIPFDADAMKALGNAVVPQVAEFVGRCVMEHAK